MPQKTSSMLSSNSSAPAHATPTGECPPVAEGLNTIAIKAQSLHALLQFMGLERQSFQTLSDSLQDAYVHQAKDLAREIAALAEGVSQ
ncbi:hypothetical protein [Achromobacter xylosoxidans]|uniref:hypothetical protein n=1 Tax=Alcaligenes xylosoxydans xylosoxydans TaxID=85698 RepID=UPI0012F489CC|nr:hypothetical protein [Achromobacter xylosoxidans]